ncbi:hypothetical protein [Flammeovirga sp. EKP202]|uniref:hypothetical protein n=1 Tax=Flammeovirga sp. EKP202 TaxID=2770592 RepID=UPI00165FA911|nr:hypothetical protein [Flammeovirga sp. EKP202]MBD0405343.1 hypothetical protein [Flammeovirga sp. EKP202]
MKLYIIILLLFMLSNPICAQGKIDKLKKSVKQKKEKPHEKVSDNEVNNATGEVIFNILKSMASGNNSNVEGNYPAQPTNRSRAYAGESELEEVPERTTLSTLRMQKYPYANGTNGKYVRNVEMQNHSSLILEGNYYNESKEISGFNGLLQFNASPKFSFLLRTNMITEKINDKEDRVELYHMNLSYHLISESEIDLWIGGGLSALSLDENYTGHNYNIGTEIFIAKPISLYFNWHFGTFDEDIKFQEIHFDLKCYLKNFYLKAGYLNTKIVDVGFNGFTVGAGVVIF